MKRLVLTLAICLGCIGILGAQNVWKPINIPGTLKGVAANGDLFIGETGIQRSQDEGETWQVVLEGTYYNGYDGFTISPNGRIFDLPYNQNHLCISDDGGDTWRNSPDFLYSPLENAPMYAVSDDTIFLYQAEGDTLLWTLDGGNTWDKTCLPFLDHDHTNLGPWFGVMLADQAGNVYIGTWGWAPPESGVFQANLDNMDEWSLIISDSYVQCMALDLEGNVVIDCPAIANNGIFFSTQRVDDEHMILVYSTDHGVTYTPIGENLPSTATVPETGLRLFKGGDQHLYCHGDVWSGGHITQTQYYKSISKADYILENFPLENTAWVQFYRSMYEDSTYYQLGIKGDTMVNEMTYKKVINCAHLGYPIEGECFGGIREDADGKCYFMSFVPAGIYAPWPLHYDCVVNTEYPLYDFSLSVCDVFPTIGGTPNVVFDTAEMELQGSTGKVLWFGNNCDNGNPYEWEWIEGIGSTHSLLYPIQWEPDNGPEYRLVEVWQDEELIYRNPHFDSNGDLVITPDTLWFDEMYYYEKTFIINNPTGHSVTITNISADNPMVGAYYTDNHPLVGIYYWDNSIGRLCPMEEVLPITLEANGGIELIVELDVVWPWAKRDEFVTVPIDIISTAGHDVVTLMIGKEATSFGLVAYPPYIQLDYYNPERFGVVSSVWDLPITITGIEEVGTNYLEIIPDSLLPVTLQNYGDFLGGSVRVRDGIHEFFETEIRISSTYGNAYIGVDNSLGFLAPFGNEWYYEIQNENGSITYQYLYQAGDTIVQDEPTQILVKINTLYDKGPHEEITREYVYERDGKLYWWNKTLEEFTVLYDFGAQEGDTWVTKVDTETLIMHVDAVETLEYEGKTYRMLHVSDPDDLFSGDIVCGIGHLTSFFPERLMNNGEGMRVEGLRCYWVEDELVFNPEGEDCDAIYSDIHGIEEDGPSTGSGTLVVYPNPTDGVLNVGLSHCGSRPEYRISNLMGQTLMTGNIIAETQRIDVSNLPQGMYFITIGDQTRKFVVK